MRRGPPKGKPAPQSNVHAFTPAGRVATIEVAGVKGKPIQTKKSKPATIKPKIQTSGHNGVQVGSSHDPNKWRCAVCKHLNENSDDICKTCKEPKTVLKPEPVKKPVKYKGPPKDHREERKRPPAQTNPKVMTIADLGPHPENLGAPKVRRKLPYSEDESLKVIQMLSIEIGTGETQ